MKHSVLSKVFLPHPNASRMSSRKLAAVITGIEKLSSYRFATGEAICVGDVFRIVATNFYFRRQCMTVLSNRLNRHFKQEIIDMLAKHDIQFAEMFCKQWLNRPFSRQFELTLV